MATTSQSLLDKLRRAGHADAWDRFVRLYAPLLYRWARLQGFANADAEDLAQTVLLKLVRLLPEYHRGEGQSFRGWLFTICRNECRDFRTRRATRPLPGADGLSDLPDQSDSEAFDESAYRQQLVSRALEIIRPDFTPDTWEAFTEFVLEERPANEVATRLGVTANAVYLARNRVLTRLRAELAGLID